MFIGGLFDYCFTEGNGESMRGHVGAAAFAKYHGARLRRTIARRLSDPSLTLIDVPTGVGFGNFCYFWLQADRRQRRGEWAFALRTAPMAPWTDLFPAIKPLLIDEGDVPWRATRVGDYRQDFGRDFTANELEQFVRDRLLSSRGFVDRLDSVHRHSDVVVINVRRGDYYSVPLFRGFYSFDIAAFISEAMRLASLERPVHRVEIVSDDPEWCRVKLAGLDCMPDVVEFSDPDEGAQRNLVRLASADRLILANSTFSYWGAHLARARNAEAQIIAPWFHSRNVDYGRAIQLDPSWTVVETIPGGWDG